MNITLECGCFTERIDMIPEIGFKEQIPLDELPQWVKELQYSDPSCGVHGETISGMRVFKIEEDKFVVIQRYAPYKLLAYIVEVCDKSRADEHIGWDIRAELDYEHQQDMVRDSHEEAYDDREPDYDEEW
tara:strand:+ start:11409 stop:11798 length:390 start_codon:yes stop_codon:yes gene_type:complete